MPFLFAFHALKLAVVFTVPVLGKIAAKIGIARL